MQPTQHLYDQSFKRQPPPRYSPPQKTPPKLDRHQQELIAAAKIEYAQRLRWRDYPDEWCRERIHLEPSWRILAAKALGLTLAEFDAKYGGELEDKIVLVLYSVRDNPKTLVRSGHQVGKTIISAAVCLWWADVYRPSRVVTTSATWIDVSTKLWGAIRSHYRNAGQWFVDVNGKPIDINDVSLRIRDDHYMIGLSSKEVEPFQGHNSPHTLVAFDEASSIEQKFFDAADAQAHRMLATGNPLSTAGPFYKYSKSTEWNTIHIACRHHPNIVFGREIIPGGPRPEWVEGRKRVWGERSPLYLSRVEGEFPEESADTLFPLSTINACFELYEAVKDLAPIPDSDRNFGLDVARAGGDKTVGDYGDWVEYKGRRVHRVRTILKHDFTDHHTTRVEVQMLNKQLGGFSKVNVDAGGEGSGLADELPKGDDCVKHVNRILFGSNPTNRDYFDCRAEMYWQLSNAMKSGNYAHNRVDELEEELSVVGGMRSYREKTIKRTNKKQLTFYLPPKEEIKELLGRSPDYADAACLENYKGTAHGLFELYEREAKKMQQANVQEPQPLDTQPEILDDTSSPQERQKIWREKVVESELLRSIGGKPKTLINPELPKCPKCGNSVCLYSDIYVCDVCGARGKLNEQVA
jgi:phage terminase large subunit